MAKYDVTFYCGHTETVNLIGPGKERERKIKNMEHYMLCRECYKKQKEEEQAKETVIKFSAEPLPSIDDDGDIVFCLWLFGNTKANKEAIKEMEGYKWGERPTSVAEMELCWYKIVKEQNLKEEKERIMEHFPDALCVKLPYIHFSYHKAAKQKKLYQAELKKLSLLSKPECPELLLNKRWNGTVYGKTGRYSVYLDGEKIMLTDEEAEKFRRYKEVKSGYMETVKEIKRKYNED